jgi:hypothetical protein
MKWQGLGMKWLAECSVEALSEALRVVAPELGECSITIPGQAGKEDPLWQASSAAVGRRFIAKFAWSRPAALRLAREIGILTALAREPRVPFLPEVVASGMDPLLLVTRRVQGRSLFEVANSINHDRAGRQLACFLAALHHPAAPERAEAMVGKLTGAHLPPATTMALRDRFARLVRPDQQHAFMRGLPERTFLQDIPRCPRNAGSYTRHSANHVVTLKAIFAAS